MFKITFDGDLPKTIRDLDKLDESSEKRLSQAINKAIEFGRAEAAREIKSQVAFPARYLTSSQNGRLVVRKRASPKNLEAVITGRQRPTSLARFARGKNPVKVTVKPGRTQSLDRAFIVGNLLAGQSGARGNVGLAIRTNGSKPSNAYKPAKLSKNVWLLYGPSVDQVFKTVREDIEQRVIDKATSEYDRLVALGSRFK